MELYNGSIFYIICEYNFLEMFNETKDFIIEQKGEDVISEKHDKDFKSRSFTIDSDEDF